MSDARARLLGVCNVAGTCCDLPPSFRRIDLAAIRIQADESSCGFYRSPPKHVTPAEFKKWRKRVPLWDEKDPPVFPSRRRNGSR